MDGGGGWLDDAPDNPAADRAAVLAALLAASEERFVIVAAPDGRMLGINRFAPGFGPADLVGRTIYDFVDPGSRPGMRACIEEVLRTGRPGAYDATSPAVGEADTPYHTRVAPLLRDGRPVAVLLLADDVTRLQANERALAESEQRLRLAVAATGMGLWTWDMDRDLVTWDEGMHTIYGVPPGAPPRKAIDYAALVHPEDRAGVAALVASALAGEVPPVYEHRIVRPDGAVRWVQTRGALVPGSRRIAGGTLDVTERRAVEERLRVAQRAEAVGQLAAGFAHNFNNLLSTILPNIDLALRRTEDAPRHLEAARHGAGRAAEIVRDLLVFAGKRPAARRARQPLAPLLARTLAVVRGTLGPAVAVDLRVPPDVPDVLGDPSQLEQVFVNLLLNARDAVQGARAPRIEVVVDVVGEGPARLVRARVIDNGAGLDDATQLRMFEPFFTTKPAGHGTGLGLASARAIARDHGGTLTCASSPGRGAELTLLLPAAPPDAPDAVAGAPAPAPRAAAAAAPPGPARGGRVLLVDDDPAVRETTAELLRAGGHAVDTAATGVEGLARFDAAPPGHYGVVLLDLSMPDLPGQAVCRAIRARAPGQRVLFFTGLALEGEGEADGVIHKPVDLATLLARVAGP